MIRRVPLVVGAALLGLAVAVAIIGGVVAEGPGRIVARSTDGDPVARFVAEDGDYTIFAIVPVEEHGRRTEEGQQEEAVRAMRCDVERPGEAEPLEVEGGPVVFEHVDDATSVGWFSTEAGDVVASCTPSVPLVVRTGRTGRVAGVLRTVVAPALGLVGLILVVVALRSWISTFFRGGTPPVASKT